MVISVFGYSVCMVPAALKIKITKSKTAHIQWYKHIDCWFERNGIKKTAKVVLFKKVSKDFKTQEGTSNETLWTIGSTVIHKDWNPTGSECGAGKFHACSRAYFCDEFRNEAGDRYIAIEIKQKDLHEWKNNPSYPNKIGFRRGLVLYECDRFGNKKG